MSIKPWEQVPLFQPGTWKAVTDDGVWRGCGVLSTDWINTFGHHEGTAQEAMVSHFPQKYAMSTAGAAADFGQGLALIGTNLANIINQLKAIATPPKEAVKATTQTVSSLTAELLKDLQHPIVMPTLRPDLTVDPEEIAAFERTCNAHLAWAHAATANRSQQPVTIEADPFTIIAAVATIIGAMGTVWSVVQGLLGSEKDMLKVPWGEFSNADGSLTHVYAQWYQGSAVRLRWTWGGTERDVYIRKMSGQIINALDDIRTIRQKQPKLPSVGLGPVRTHQALASSDMPRATILPWGYTGEKKLSRALPRAQELIAQARGLTAEEHFRTPPQVLEGECPAHVQNALAFARNQIEANMGVRQRIAQQLSFDSYARQRAETAMAWGGQLLSIWMGTSPVPVKSALSIIATMVTIEIDLVRHIPLFELAQEYGNATRQIEEAAELLRHIDTNFPACSSE